MTAVLTDSELGSYLLDARGRQWIAGALNDRDPYAVLLRGFSEPAGLYRRAAGRGPLFRSSAGPWVATADEACAEVVGHPRFGLWYPDPATGLGSPYLMPRPLLAHVLSLDEAYLCLPRAEYAALRAATDEALGPDQVRRWRGAAERIATRRLSRDAGTGRETDLVPVARDIAASVAAEVLGIAAADRAAFAAECAAAAPALDAVCCPPQFPVARRMEAGVRALRARLAGAPPDPRAAVLLAVAGVEITANLVISALLADDRQAQPAAAVVDAVLRRDPPVQLVHRVALEDTELAGHAIEAGAELVALVARPDEAGAPAGPPLALAGGLYLTMLAPLARLVAESALTAAAALGALPRPAGPGVRRLRSPVTQAWARLPVRLG